MKGNWLPETKLTADLSHFLGNLSLFGFHMLQIYTDMSQQRGGEFEGLPLSINASHQSGLYFVSCLGQDQILVLCLRKLVQ